MLANPLGIHILYDLSGLLDDALRTHDACLFVSGRHVGSLCSATHKEKEKCVFPYMSVVCLYISLWDHMYLSTAGMECACFPAVIDKQVSDESVFSWDLA